MFMRDFWKPMSVSGKPVRELLLLFLLLWVQQSYVEGTKRSVYLRESPKMMEEPRIEIVR